MATVYPNAIDNAISMPLVYDNITNVDALTVNRLRNAILAIETALGITPAGSYTATGGVSARLNAIDTRFTTIDGYIADIEEELAAIGTSFDGTTINLGTPPDGFLDGITTLESTTPITDAINTFNNIMLYMAPAQPQSMSDLAIDVDSLSTISVFTGKISTLTSPSAGYYGPFIAGTTSTRIIHGLATQAFTLTSHTTLDSTTGFSDADKGTLAVLVNGVQVTSFDLGASFDEDRRANALGQGSSYAGGGSAEPPTVPLRVVDTYTNIYSIGRFNGFPPWQKGVVQIKNTTLTPGYNSFQLKHTINFVDRLSQTFELFYDNGAVNPSFNTPTLTILGSPTHFNYLSGIKFLSASETLTLSTTISNAFVNTYLQSPLNYSFTAGIATLVGSLSDPGLSASPSLNLSAPNTADQLVISKTFAISVLNQQTINQIATVVYSNVYGTTFQAQSVSTNLLINTYNTAASTATTEAFVDETRRLLPDINGATGSPAAYPNDYVGIPPVITGQWTSTAALTNGNAQSYNARLIYPAINFSSAGVYSPAQIGGTNYSGFTGTQVYYRAMYSAGNPRSTGTLTVAGVNLLDITIGSPHIKLEMKLPGPSGTGWLDFSLPFNVGTFTGATGEGCRTGNSGSIFNWSCGTFSTGNTGFMYILRISIFDATRPITALSESFT